MALQAEMRAPMPGTRSSDEKARSNEGCCLASIRCQLNLAAIPRAFLGESGPPSTCRCRSSACPSVAEVLAGGASPLVNQLVRVPRCTISDANLLESNPRSPRPGEDCRALREILFVDEMPELFRSILGFSIRPTKRCRQHHRHPAFLYIPCRFVPVAAMNPCPCRHQLIQP